MPTAAQGRSAGRGGVQEGARDAGLDGGQHQETGEHRRCVAEPPRQASCRIQRQPGQNQTTTHQNREQVSMFYSIFALSLS